MTEKNLSLKDKIFSCGVLAVSGLASLFMSFIAAGKADVTLGLLATSTALLTVTEAIQKIAEEKVLKGNSLLVKLSEKAHAFLVHSSIAGIAAFGLQKDFGNAVLCWLLAMGFIALKDLDAERLNVMQEYYKSEELKKLEQVKER